MDRTKFTISITRPSFVALPAITVQLGCLAVIALGSEKAACSLETFLVKYNKCNLKCKRDLEE